MLAHPLNPWFLLALIHILIACLRLLAICQILLPHLASLRFEFFLLLPLLYYFSCLKWSEITSHKHRFPSQKTNQIERNRYILYLFIARFFCTDYFFFKDFWILRFQDVYWLFLDNMFITTLGKESLSVSGTEKEESGMFLLYSRLYYSRQDLCRLAALRYFQK